MRSLFLTGAAAFLAAGCGPEAPPADLVLVGGRVYSLAWTAPGPGGLPAADAPYEVTEGWRPDATAVALTGNRIVFVGGDDGAAAHVGEGTRVIDLEGAVVLPGLVDSHAHIAELGRNLSRIDLVGVETEEEAIARARARAAEVPAGSWIVGAGWDEGAWADRYPSWDALNEAVPDHPVWLRGLHGFAGWANRRAFEAAGVGPETQAPVGGEIGRAPDGALNGLLLNRAVTLIDDVIPEPGPAEREREILAALAEMARSGYVAVHEAGTDAESLAALERLDAKGLLPLRFYAMLSGRDPALLADWLRRGPSTRAGESDPRLFVRSVKAYYDGSLGVRGARMLEDYSDQAGHRGVSGAGYGFNQDSVAAMLRAGFQVGIHAIGDAGNRESLDFLEGVYARYPEARNARNRIEHAQVVHPDDFSRFAELGLVASMQPPHAVEDMPWAEARIGPQRIGGAYAWRTFLERGVPLVFNADNPGSDHSPFYGLHSAVTRRTPDLQPYGGWYPEQAVTPEEAVRAYTTGAAWAAHLDSVTGVVAVGRWADLTVMDVDPFRVLRSEQPESILEGRILLTVVGGVVVYEGTSGG
ncbi:MAG: amidohydrolase family protein [Gemmatimonadota bacterium]|nr:amidohydrolase family protein [Gemmatimonadota bacterium]